jgi:hypothetical protein
MRLKHHIIEENNIETLKSLLTRDCSKFLSVLKGTHDLLYRGKGELIDKWKVFKSRVHSGREPKDTDPILHDELNNEFRKKFGWPVRNGIFSTSNIDNTTPYGTSYMFFPIEPYTFCWSPKIEDLYTDFIENNRILSSTYFKNMYGNLVGVRFTKNGRPLPFTYEPEEYFPYEIEREILSSEFKGEFKKVRYDDNIYSAIRIEPEEWMKEYSPEGKTTKEIVNMYTNKGLKEAINSANEICFNCRTYYLVSMVYNDFLMNWTGSNSGEYDD